MHVHSAGVSEVVKAPHLIQQLVAGEYPVGGGGQVEQQLQLLGRGVHRLAVDDQLIGVQIDDQLVKGQLFGAPLLLAAGGAPQHSVDAGQDLLHLKGLDDVIVRTHFQAGDLVAGLPFGGEHDDGHLAALPDLFQYGPAIHHRQHDVQQHQVGLESPELLHPLAAVLGHQGLKALFFQVEVQKLRNVAVVLYDQNFFCHHQHRLFHVSGKRQGAPQSLSCDRERVPRPRITPFSFYYKGFCPSWVNFL